jgi:hypothetical protein
VSTQIDVAKTALSGKLIIQATDRELLNTMLFIYNLIGLRIQHFPTPGDDVILLDFIRTEYYNKTLDELILCFKLAIKGELELEDAKVYDQFTCEYLARCMTAYRKWLKKVNSDIKPEVKELPAVITETTPEDMWNDIQEWETKEQIDIKFIPPYLCGYFRVFGKIVVTELMKADYMTRAKEIIKAEMFNESEGAKLRKDNGPVLEFKKFMIMYSEKKWSSEYLSRFRNLAYKMLVYDYLTKKL